MEIPVINIEYPFWLADTIDWQRRYVTDGEKMAVAILLSRLNVMHRTGEPFGAVIFRSEDGQLISVGMSQVVRQSNSILHAEVMAIMMAEQRLRAFNLRVGGQRHELFSSANPVRCVSEPHTGAV